MRQLDRSHVLNTLCGGRGSVAFGPQCAQDVGLDVVPDVLGHLEPSLLILFFDSLVVGRQPVLELETGLTPGHGRVAAVDQDVRQGLEELRQVGLGRLLQEVLRGLELILI